MLATTQSSMSILDYDPYSLSALDAQNDNGLPTQDRIQVVDEDDLITPTVDNLAIGRFPAANTKSYQKSSQCVFFSFNLCLVFILILV